MNVNIALCYGGRQEVVDACRSLVADLLAEGVAPENLAESIDAKGLAGNLYAADLPDTDLVIRTSRRVSTFGISPLAIRLRRVRLRGPLLAGLSQSGPVASPT